MNYALLNLLAVIVVFGVVMGRINAYIPMMGSIKSLLNIVVVIVLILYILQFFGIIPTILPIIQIFK